jgi:hypothetical protein
MLSFILPETGQGSLCRLPRIARRRGALAPESPAFLCRSPAPFFIRLARDVCARMKPFFAPWWFPGLPKGPQTRTVHHPSFGWSTGFCRREPKFIIINPRLRPTTTRHQTAIERQGMSRYKARLAAGQPKCRAGDIGWKPGPAQWQTSCLFCCGIRRRWANQISGIGTFDASCLLSIAHTRMKCFKEARNALLVGKIHK